MRPGALERILKRPPPPAQQRAHKYPLDCDWVLTSEQYIREREEKADEKKQQEKKKRIKERERRKEKAKQKEAAKKKKGKA